MIPYESLGVLVNARILDEAVEQGGQPRGYFYGSAFCLRHRDYYLTAAHCVQDVEVGTLAIHCIFPRRGQVRRPVAEVIVHPDADLAVVRVEPLLIGGAVPDLADHPVRPFSGIDFISEIGDDFFACGFPNDTFSVEDDPTVRLFKCHFQRFMRHEGQTGPYRYLAGELSIPAPRGLSGGPVFRPRDLNGVVALVTGNIESATDRHIISDVEENGHRFTEVTHRVINYGVSVLLRQVDDWIDAHVPGRQV